MRLPHPIPLIAALLIGILSPRLLPAQTLPAVAEAGESLPHAATLRGTLGRHFLIGVAAHAGIPAEADTALSRLVGEQFNAVVAENCMKGEVIHPEAHRYDWRQADELMAYAERHDMAVTGHCLVWHSQPPRWMFTDADGLPVSRDTLIRRMHDHIRTVMTRYKGRIKGWDVVNEAFNDDGTLRATPYLQIIGRDYIELAFRFAQEADPGCELYINDYNMARPAKRDSICGLVRALKAKGVRIDAIGMQSHVGLDYPDLREWERTMDSIAATGCRVMITEMDVNVLPNPRNFGGAEVSQDFAYQTRLDPYRDGLTQAATQAFESLYLDIFRVIRRHADQIARVTLWGTDDGTSWLNDFPVHGRTNYPLFIDRQHQLKPVVRKIIELFQDTNPDKPTSPSL